MTSGMKSHHDIFSNRHILEDLDILEGSADSHMGHLIRAFSNQVSALKKDMAGPRRIYPCNQVNRSGFSCAIGADNGEDQSFFNFEGQMVYSLQPPKVFRYIF